MIAHEAAPTSGRIAALDLLRGYLILVIASVHLAYYPSLLGSFDGRGQLWVSEAEGFFFISGLLIGLIRSKDVRRGQFRRAVGKVWRRGLRLYVAGLVLTALYIVWGRWLIGVDPDAVKAGLDQTGPWWQIAINMIDLKYSYGWGDFLMYYAGFLFVTPAVLWLLSKRLWYVVLAATLGVWYWRWTGGYGPYNSFLQWQVYFFMGSIIGFYWQGITSWFDSLAQKTRHWLALSAVVVAATTLAASVVAVFGSTAPRAFGGKWIAAINANFLYQRMLVDGRIGLLRPVVLLIVFAGAFTVVRRFEPHIIKWSGWLFLPFGRNSLYVYIVESLALFTIPFFLLRGSFWTNSLVELLIVAIVWFCVRYRILFTIIPR